MEVFILYVIVFFMFILFLLYRNYVISHYLQVSIYGGPTKLSVTSNLSEMWGVDNAGTVYRWSNVSHSWGEITGMKLKEIHVSRSTGGYLQVMGVNTDDFGVMYDFLFIFLFIFLFFEQK